MKVPVRRRRRCRNQNRPAAMATARRPRTTPRMMPRRLSLPSDELSLSDLEVEVLFTDGVWTALLLDSELDGETVDDCGTGSVEEPTATAVGHVRVAMSPIDCEG